MNENEVATPELEWQVQTKPMSLVRRFREYTIFSQRKVAGVFPLCCLFALISIDRDSVMSQCINFLQAGHNKNSPLNEDVFGIDTISG